MIIFETISIKNGKVHNISYHNRRLNYSSEELGIFQEYTDLRKYLYNINFDNDKHYKCKVIFNGKVENIEISEYKIKEIKKLKIVNSDIEYKHKYFDRSELDCLYKKRGDCDDILICKNSLVRDTYYCNICFYKRGKWFTPDSPLLRGTKREKLIENYHIKPKKITIETIKDYEKASLINSMIDLEEVIIPIENILS